MDGVLYFGADGGTHGREFWRSDGTQSGTYMVKDIWPGLADGSPRYMRLVDGVLYFSANDGESTVPSSGARKAPTPAPG